MTPNEILFKALKNAASDSATRTKAHDNFITTFERLGVEDHSERLAFLVFSAIVDSFSIEDAERKIRHRFEQMKTIGGKTVFELIQAGLDARFELLFTQLAPHLVGVNTAIDYGCGAGVLAQMFHDRMGITIEGVDVCNFPADGVTIPIRQFDGYRVPVADHAYECAVLTNVMHHEADNERILVELERIVSRKLVIIETVPEGDTDEEARADWGRMILNDALWNRFFNYHGIPCPGTYDTPQKWIRRIGRFGWRNTHSKDLGFDQDTIQDRHHLLIFER